MDAQNSVDQFGDILPDAQQWGEFMDYRDDDAFLEAMNTGVSVPPNTPANSECMMNEDREDDFMQIEIDPAFVKFMNTGETSQINFLQSIANVVQPGYIIGDGDVSIPAITPTLPECVLNEDRKGEGKMRQAAYMTGSRQLSKTPKKQGKPLHLKTANRKDRKLSGRKLIFSKENTPKLSTTQTLPSTSTQSVQKQTTSTLQPLAEHDGNIAAAQFTLQTAYGSARTRPISLFSVVRQEGSAVPAKHHGERWPKPTTRKYKPRSIKTATIPLPTITPQTMTMIDLTQTGCGVSATQIIPTIDQAQAAREALDREIDQLADGKNVCHDFNIVNPLKRRRAHSVPSKSKKQRVDSTPACTVKPVWSDEQENMLHAMSGQYVQSKIYQNKLKYFCETYERLINACPTPDIIAELYAFNREHAIVSSQSNKNNLL
ncbi:uncharacterized protein LOC142263628 [Anomaloglossus baeobatrachus]|uniref:uncharacterized protein LOC142263628 n=1 Tax=Anomaloglossus baeobatrachus TaxID=238106 RepID=UPI003F4F9119